MNRTYRNPKEVRKLKKEKYKDIKLKLFKF